MEPFRDFKNALNRTASLPPSMRKLDPDNRGNAAITILRMFLWLMPASLIPAWFLLFAAISQVLPDPAAISITLLLTLAATVGVGYFDRRLSFQQRRATPIDSTVEILASPLLFVLIQSVIAPVLLVGFLHVFGTLAAHLP